MTLFDLAGAIICFGLPTLAHYLHTRRAKRKELVQKALDRAIGGY